MNCHSQLWADSPYLEPVRASFRDNKPIEWVRVHDLPEFTYFNHSIHISKGVGCSTCHGQIDTMPAVFQENTLQMEWCIACHRAPENFIRPKSEIFNMQWQAGAVSLLFLGRVRAVELEAAGMRAEIARLQDDVAAGHEAAEAAAHFAEMMSAREAEPTTPDVRDTILALNGKEYWRSLEEHADTPEFRRLIAEEYPHEIEHWDDGLSRRNFVKVMGASLALAGLSGCVIQPNEKIVPYVKAPEGMLPGKANFFATGMTLSGVTTGLLVKAYEGRPVKIEGNPDHPGSLGATDILAQGSLLPQQCGRPSMRTGSTAVPVCVSSLRQSVLRLLLINSTG